MVGALGRARTAISPRVACVFFCLLTARHLPRSMEAHCKVTTHYLLLSSPYSLPDGSPLHSDHALPSPFFSLFPTF